MKKLIPFLFAGLALYGCSKEDLERDLIQKKATAIEVSTRRSPPEYFNTNIVNLVNSTEGFRCTLNFSHITRDKSIGRDDLLEVYYWDTLGSHSDGANIHDREQDPILNGFDQKVYADSAWGKKCLDLASRVETITGPMSDYRIPMTVIVSLPAK
jgi:hypothetical protein